MSPSCRSTILSEGLFDQIRVDHGKVFYLLLFVQELLAHLRNNQELDPHRQTTSKQVYELVKVFSKSYVTSKTWIMLFKKSYMRHVMLILVLPNQFQT